MLNKFQYLGDKYLIEEQCREMLHVIKADVKEDDSGITVRRYCSRCDMTFDVIRNERVV